jgi:hypothetical protein
MGWQALQTRQRANADAPEAKQTSTNNLSLSSPDSETVKILDAFASKRAAAKLRFAAAVSLLRLDYSP